MSDEVTITRRQLRYCVARIATLADQLLKVIDHPRDPLPDDNHVSHVTEVASLALGAAIQAGKLAAYSYPPAVSEKRDININAAGGRS